MDPALWELLRAEAGADGDRVLEAIIRLARPGIEIPDIRIVSRFGTVATCRIRARDIFPVRAQRDVVSLKAARGLNPGFESAVGAAVPDAFGQTDFRPADVRRGPGLTLTGKGVVVASVDWGVDVDSAVFRWPADPAAADGDRPVGGTRFLSFWDQRDLAAGPRPDPYGYGTVHDREQIDRALHDPRPYEQLGYHPAIADRGGHGTHGTHVLDIAAGNGQAGGPSGIAPEADLIFVHLADRTTGGLANLGDSVRLLEAVDFISRTAGSQPCVINISAGRTCGPKDGTTLVERALDELLAATPGRFVVNSAGNYFGWRTHSCGRVAPGESRSLTFVIDPADITLNELEIWYDGADEFAVRIDPPGYTGGRAVRLGERSDLLIDGQAVGRVYHRKHDPNNGDNHIVAYIDPIGRAGNWTVTLEARQVNSGRFHAWIERDDTCRGCQARFTPADSNPVTTIGTITASRLPLIVGAYDGHDPARPVAHFSSSGPSRDLRPKPDLVAPGVDVLAARSASIIDSHNPGLLVRKSGTSMATPHVTGAVALCLEAAGNALSARQIRSLVLGSCDPARDPDAPYRLGRGYLNIPHLIADLQRTLTGPGAKEPTMNTHDSITLLAAAPATAYREYLYRPHSQLARWIDDRFDVVARPGQRIDQALQLGDVLLEITLGQVKPGRCLVLKAHDPELEISPRRLSAGQLLLRLRERAEMSEPLPVEPTVETEGSNPSAGVAAEHESAGQDSEQGGTPDFVLDLARSGLAAEAAMPRRNLVLAGYRLDQASIPGAHRSQLMELVRDITRRIGGREGVTAQLRIVGHTDASGTEVHNETLGRQRAQGVRDAVAAALPPAVASRVTFDVTSQGERAPLASNLTSEGRAQNRRVEISVNYAEPAVAVDARPAMPKSGPVDAGVQQLPAGVVEAPVDIDMPNPVQTLHPLGLGPPLEVRLTIPDLTAIIADKVTVSISDGTLTPVYEQILPNTFLTSGTYLWQWDGRNTNGVFDAGTLTRQLALVLTFEEAGKVTNTRSKFLRSHTTRKWVTAKVDRGAKTIAVDVYIDCQNKENLQATEFQRLRSLVVNGIGKYWSRSVTIAGDVYAVTTTAHQRSAASVGLDLYVETDADYRRSHNSGIIDGSIFYNQGHYGGANASADHDFEETAAHEFGHSILWAVGGKSLSWGHKGTANDSLLKFWNFQDPSPSATKYPAAGEIDLMKYYTDSEPADFYSRVIVASEDALRLIGLSSVTFSLE